MRHFEVERRRPRDVVIDHARIEKREGDAKAGGPDDDVEGLGGTVAKVHHLSLETIDADARLHGSVAQGRRNG
jgi:hypothetical protein